MTELLMDNGIVEETKHNNMFIKKLQEITDRVLEQAIENEAEYTDELIETTFNYENGEEPTQSTQFAIFEYYTNIDTTLNKQFKYKIYSEHLVNFINMYDQLHNIKPRSKYEKIISKFIKSNHRYDLTSQSFSIIDSTYSTLYFTSFKKK